MKILWLNTRLMYPLDAGGKIRTYNILKHLRNRADVDVISLAFDPREEDLDALRAVCRNFIPIPATDRPRRSPGFIFSAMGNLFGRLPLSLSLYRNKAQRNAIREQVRNYDYDLIISDFLTPMVNLPEPWPRPLAIFQHNVEAVIWERLAARQPDPIRRAYFTAQAGRMQRFEARSCRAADGIICVSRLDAETFRHRYGVSKTPAIDTGVDVAAYRPGPNAESERPTVVFTGTMDWMANRDGVRWFLDSVWPRVIEAVPEALFQVVGKNPPSDLLKRDRTDRHLEVTGWVDDIRPYLHGAWVVIVPLRVGGGTRLKIMEALAAEKAVVSTAIGAEGLGLTHGKDVVIADRAPPFAEHCTKMLTDANQRNALGAAGRALVDNHYDWPIIADQFLRACNTLIP